jgi:hypothetical protein
MQPHSGFKKMTEEEIEAVKKDGSFDRIIVDWLIPPGDPVRRFATVNRKLEELVSREVNPWVIKLLWKGAENPPGGVYSSAPKEKDRPSADAISNELTAFLKSASHASAGPVLDLRDAKSYTRQLKRTLEELAWRKALKQRARQIAEESNNPEEALDGEQ